VRGVLIVSLVLAAAACGSTTETSTAAAEDAPATTQSPTTTAAPTTTTAAPTTTTTAAPSDEPVSLETDPELQAGITYQTATEIPIRFNVPDSNFSIAALNQWSATLIFENDNMTSDVGSEPGFTMAMAEEGATRDSVAESMINSREDTIAYERAEGLFEGRDVITLEGTYEHNEDPGPVVVMTGDRSHFAVLFHEERTYRSQIFEEQGRVFVVSIDCRPDDVALTLAELAPVFESLEIGVDS